MISDITIVGLSLGLILFGAGVIDTIFLLLSKGKSAPIYSNTIGSVVTIFTRKRVNPVLLVVAGGVIGMLMLGGFGTAWAGLTASITGDGDGVGDQVVPTGCVVDYVTYASGTSVNGSSVQTAFIADDTDKANYFIDTKNLSSGYIQTGVDINSTLNIWIKDAPTTGSECNARLYVVGPSFKDQISTGASADDIYDLLDGSRTLSNVQGLQTSNRVDGVSWEQKAYLNDGSASTTSSDQEITVVNYGAGEQKNTLGLAFDLDSSAWDKAKKNNNFKIYVLQQVGSTPSSSDPVIFTYTIRKGTL